MTWLYKIKCWLFGHTDLRIFTSDSTKRTTTYVCRDCLAVWTEKDGYWVNK